MCAVITGARKVFTDKEVRDIADKLSLLLEAWEENTGTGLVEDTIRYHTISTARQVLWQISKRKRYPNRYDRFGHQKD